VRIGNWLRGGPSSSLRMRHDVAAREEPLPPARAGDVVYLGVELAAGGQIHEIGSQARVVHVGADELGVELGGARASCRAAHVLRRTAWARRGWA